MSDATAYDLTVALLGILLGSAGGLVLVVQLPYLFHAEGFPDRHFSDSNKHVARAHAVVGVVVAFTLAVSVPVLLLVPTVAWEFLGMAAAAGAAFVVAASFIGSSTGTPKSEPKPVEREGPWASA